MHEPCKVLLWREDGDPWDGAEGLVGVLAEGDDALIEPIEADILNNPVEAGGKGFHGGGLERGNFVAPGALVGKIVAFAGAHVMLDAHKAEVGGLDVGQAVFADEERARAIRAAEPFLAGTGVSIDAEIVDPGW